MEQKTSLNMEQKITSLAGIRSSILDIAPRAEVSVCASHRIDAWWNWPTFPLILLIGNAFCQVLLHPPHAITFLHPFFTLYTLKVIEGNDLLAGGIAGGSTTVFLAFHGGILAKNLDALDIQKRLAWGEFHHCSGPQWFTDKHFSESPWFYHPVSCNNTIDNRKCIIVSCNTTYYCPAQLPNSVHNTA